MVADTILFTALDSLIMSIGAFVYLLLCVMFTCTETGTDPVINTSFCKSSNYELLYGKLNLLFS